MWLADMSIVSFFFFRKNVCQFTRIVKRLLCLDTKWSSSYYSPISNGVSLIECSYTNTNNYNNNKMKAQWLSMIFPALSFFVFFLPFLQVVIARVLRVYYNQPLQLLT